MKSIDARTMSLRLAHACLFSALLLAGARTGSAQTPTAPPDGMQRLAPYIDTWEGEGTLSVAGQDHPLRIRHEWLAFAGGWGIQVHEKITSPGLPDYVSENLFGVDPATGALHLFTVSNSGDTHDHFGPWTDEQHCTLVYHGVQDGKPLVEEIPFSLDGPNQYSFTSTVTVGGEPTMVLKGTMRRVAVSQK